MGRIQEIAESTESELEQYLDHLGWAENPFARSATLDEYVLPSPEDIADISAQIQSYTGPILVHSRYSGAGKTTLLKMILEEFSEDYRTIYVGEHNVTSYELAALVADKLDVGKSSSTKLTEQKIGDAEFDAPVLLGIDEFGLNDPETLHVLQFLNDLDGFHVLLTGMSSQWEAIGSLGSDGRAFQRRVSYSLELEPFTQDQTEELIQRRIASAEGLSHEEYEQASLEPFTDEAIATIHERSMGVPAVVAAACAELVGLAAYQHLNGGESSITSELATAVEYADPEVE
ncbi:AAA family ATPase [Natronoarchaeum rubrum]|uniref:AAA family ATPase n=1 Tax=Natronoarchaeum rubrum TaxID=755311 RepID=UPI002112CFC0|nr:AAA family ATPase [Natronoarchaeum rubrum]